MPRSERAEPKLANLRKASEEANEVQSSTASVDPKRTHLITETVAPNLKNLRKDIAEP
jgi:hypothetical protein